MRYDVREAAVYGLVAEYVAAWNAHDADRLASLFAEEGSYGEFGLGRVILGREEIRRYLVTTFGAVPDLAISLTGHPVCSRDRVSWKWVMAGTHDGEFAGVPSTGRRFEVRGISALLTRGDKIVRGADYFDVTSVIGQLMPESGGRSGTGTASPDISGTSLAARPELLADEDNIGYGE